MSRAPVTADGATDTEMLDWLERRNLLTSFRRRRGGSCLRDAIRKDMTVAGWLRELRAEMKVPRGVRASDAETILPKAADDPDR